jgi:hypothetical protein
MLLMPRLAQGRMLERMAQDGLELHLYSNDYTPVVTDTIEKYVEVLGGGYSSKTLAQWIIDESRDPVELTHPEVTFMFAGIPQTPNVFGYYVTQDGILMWAERFDARPDFEPPFIVTGLGDRIHVQPNFSMQPRHVVGVSQV